ncbi:hypothetical protein C2G38_2212231 [Gigaspora rosea]|uniref:RNase H type-1 domain-containing protein n=1 Tax=Gigaspora rosea TaxID=44941 RepID=A0A397UDI5_9GLOM|nr:hypothetical protein C2G38_2212231 [Gigaspora rosea]
MEYHIQNIVINRSACNKILSHHIGLVNHKAKLSCTIPTSILLHPQLYNIKNIWDIQLQYHISNFIKRLNDNNLLGTTTHIRIQQIQNNLWLSTNIFLHPNPTIDGPNRYTTNFKIIQLFKHLDNFNIPFTIKEGSISLESILSSHSKYPTFKKQIRHHHLLFLDQLTSFDNSCLLDWKHISPRLNKITKGKIPLWFTFLEDQTTTRNPTSIPILPNLLISTVQIPSFFNSSTALDTLQSICNYNSYLTELTFYTDGSVIDLGNSQCSMAELVAVLLAISTASRNCSLQIFTDSQFVISKYNSLIYTMPLSKPFNIPYWPIWNTLLNFIRSYNLNITFYKVIAHQDDEFNNKANQLAHCHQIALHLLSDLQNNYNHNFTLSIDNFSIELPICHCVRTICHAHILAFWFSQNHFQQWLQISQYIYWNATWLYINNNQKISNFSHSFHSSTLKSFRIKILLDDFPAPHILH